MDTGVQTMVHARPQAQRAAERIRARPAPGKAYQASVAAAGVADLGLLNPQTILALQATAGNALPSTSRSTPISSSTTPTRSS
jgi:hypothetical protein